MHIHEACSGAKVATTYSLSDISNRLSTIKSLALDRCIRGILFRLPSLQPRPAGPFETS